VVSDKFELASTGPASLLFKSPTGHVGAPKRIEWSPHAHHLPKATTEETPREVADKAEDPTTKDGPVGDFCRAYDVMEGHCQRKIIYLPKRKLGIWLPLISHGYFGSD
jgi:hypothetical protein